MAIAVAFVWAPALPALYAQTTSVEIDTIRTSIRPQLELRVPSGEVRQDTTIPVGESRFNVNSVFDLYTGSISGEIRGFRSIGDVTPYLAVGLQLDAEPPLTADVTDGVAGLAADETIERDRFAGTGLRWELVPGAVVLSTEVREKLFLSGETERNTVDLTPEVAWEIEDIRPILPQRTPETVGGLLQVAFTQRTSLDAGSAVDLRWRVSAVLNHRPADMWRWEHRLTATTPLVVWDRERSQPLGLGGFDSVRGVDAGSVPGRRAIVLGNTLSRALGPGAPADGNGVQRVRFHSLRAIAVGDVAMLQNDWSLVDVPRVIAGAGLGLASTVSAPGSIHLDVRAYAALPAERSPMPILYLRTSLFALSEGG